VFVYLSPMMRHNLFHSFHRLLSLLGILELALPKPAAAQQQQQQQQPPPQPLLLFVVDVYDDEAADGEAAVDGDGGAELRAPAFGLFLRVLGALPWGAVLASASSAAGQRFMARRGASRRCPWSSTPTPRRRPTRRCASAAPSCSRTASRAT
jgi:hypothetical protein